ncbi:DinB family protein [uncultured Winogradskyella sp.]|uniref:DinB family protein n=1 Tax=uncultured Winogradskyella sp. TaxID=395353 RepID=UPI0026327027|nr:DinB family protein [uncultured Winogradskyella sp.]
MDKIIIGEHEYGYYYKSYIEKSTNASIVDGLKGNLDKVVSFFSAIPEDKHNYKYAEEKWTIKEILLHIIDTERIFTYRALRVARYDKTALPGFEQNGYVDKSYANHRSLENLIEEFVAVRQATIALYASFNSEVLLQIGEASGYPISVRALAYITIGHENHHIEIINNRYL